MTEYVYACNCPGECQRPNLHGGRYRHLGPARDASVPDALRVVLERVDTGERWVYGTAAVGLLFDEVEEVASETPSEEALK